MPRALAGSAALGAALAVAAGAFGAHALAGRLDQRGLDLWRTADRYLALAAVGALAIAAWRRSEPAASNLDGWLLLAGGALFAATLFALALGAPSWLGAVTPLGGVGMIAGFTLFALSNLRGVSS